MELLPLLNGWQALAPLHLFQGPVEPEQRHLHSEQQVALPRLHNAADTQLAPPYSTRQATVRLHDRLAAQVVHRLQALAQAVKHIPAQHGLELALALLCSVPHNGHQNDVPQW